MNFGILRHVQLVYPKPDRTGEWGMGNGGFFDSLTIWRAQKERTPRNFKNRQKRK